ncbi:hypothetical protein GCM10009332_01450 [Shewanella gelidii]|uniref:Uncharacterized protein n=1 Tax=Shewanella gelidii TaxID=1642821 RepID=A0A917JH70_9GAMM|nr:hypothetical protein GCM10009332_01450 [Shewanella gelidii]
MFTRCLIITADYYDAPFQYLSREDAYHHIVILTILTLINVGDGRGQTALM